MNVSGCTMFQKPSWQLAAVRTGWHWPPPPRTGAESGDEHGFGGSVTTGDSDTERSKNIY